MDKLNEIFYNSKSGYMSKNKFIKAAKMMGFHTKESSDYYDKQAVNQIYKKPNQKKKFTPIESPRYQPGNLQIDLMIMTKFPKNQNKGYQYMLNVLDVYSRYVKSYPLKNKTPNEIFPHIQQYVEDFKKSYPKNKISVTVDAGNEFKGKVKSYFKDNNIDVYIATPNENTKMRNMLVERYHRTFWEKLRKILMHNESLKWVEYYEDITDNYNNSIHSKTQMTPKSIFIEKEQRPLENQIYAKPINKLDVGDTVRFLKNKKEFSKKSFEPKWSVNTYKIDSINGSRYFLKHNNGEEKRGSYLVRELQKVDEADKSNYQQEVKENEKANKLVRKNRKTGLDVNRETGQIEMPKRLKPESTKRTKKPIKR